ncbi:MAG: PDZ domain-containing protein [Bacteroidetes bacterium]|nr:PDZ domain-containing protein [Bacteroidota bacterium]
MRTLLIPLILISTAYSQAVEYSISFENALHHEAEVTVRWSNITLPVLEAHMSRSSPGRYSLHEFAKNVYNVRAMDGKKRPLPITRPNPYQWNILEHDGTVILTYTVFGDRVDGTYLGIDQTHAHVNMPAAFMWGRGLDDRPISLTFITPKGSSWKIATQLQRTQNPAAFTAPNFQYFMDSPTELSNHRFREWEVDSNGKRMKMKIVLHGSDSASYLDAYARMTRALVFEHLALWKSLPPFEFDEYLFLCDYHPFAVGDGMEHRNSTVLTSSQSIKSNPLGLLNTVSHEFFHSWNVERIRPDNLEPFNFEEVNMSDALWFAEGFTTYYGPLMMKRAQLTSLDDFAQSLTGLLQLLYNSPGAHNSSPVEMSQFAPFTDGALFTDVGNTGNTFLSYYQFGAAIALGLDLTIRTTVPGKTLDDVMRRAKELHGLTEKPYSLDDLRLILGSVMNNQTAANRFFEQHVNGKVKLNYESLLSSAGLLVRRPNNGKSWIGLPSVKFDNTAVVIGNGTQMGTPAYKAGLDRGDVIVSIDGRKITSSADIDSVLTRHAPGESVSVECIRRGEQKILSIQLEEDPKVEIIPFENVGKSITAEVAAFRESWLGKKSNEQISELVKYCPLCNRSYEFLYKFCPLDGKALTIVPYVQ